MKKVIILDRYDLKVGCDYLKDYFCRFDFPNLSKEEIQKAFVIVFKEPGFFKVLKYSNQKSIDLINTLNTEEIGDIFNYLHPMRLDNTTLDGSKAKEEVIVDHTGDQSVGSKIQIGTHTCLIILAPNEDNSDGTCSKCCFAKSEGCALVKCTPSERTDKLDVYFKEIKPKSVK